MLSSRIDNIAISGTMEISAKIIEMRSQGIDIIDLCVGEPDLPTPDHIKEAAIKAINENRTKYTANSGIKELKSAIKDKFYNDYGATYSTNEVIISAGAKQALYNSIQVIVNSGEEVIIPSPYYASYKDMVTLAGGIAKIVQTSPENSFKISSQEFIENISSNVKAILLCNPNNPTGAVYTKDELKSILEIAEEKNLYVISDEIYEKFVYDNEEFTSVSSLGEKYKDRTIIINGVSKTYRMTGWRVGYSVANKELVFAMNKLQSHSTSNACTISQYAALEALTGLQEEANEQKSIFEERRNLIRNELSEITCVNFIEPHGAFYFFVNIKELLNSSSTIKTSSDFCIKLLDEVHVATVPGTVFGMEGYIRISYAKSKEELAEAIKRMKEFIKTS